MHKSKVNNDVQFSGCITQTVEPNIGDTEEEYPLLAQLVEQLTLNQWVPGSSP